jgi:RNA methyltransferase, TrmH family
VLDPVACDVDREHRHDAADPADGRSYRDVDYRGPLAIVVGSEQRGVARQWLVAADSIVAIPMLGMCDSAGWRRRRVITARSV